MWGRTASHTRRTWKNPPAQIKPADFPRPCAPAGEKLPPDMHFITVLLSWMIFIHATQPQSDGNSFQTTCIKVVQKFFFYSNFIRRHLGHNWKIPHVAKYHNTVAEHGGGGGLFKLICQCDVDLNTAQTHSTRAELKHSWTETCFLSGRSSLLGCVWLNSSGKG